MGSAYPVISSCTDIDAVLGFAVRLELRLLHASQVDHGLHFKTSETQPNKPRHADTTVALTMHSLLSANRLGVLGIDVDIAAGCIDH